MEVKYHRGGTYDVPSNYNAIFIHQGWKSLSEFSVGDKIYFCKNNGRGEYTHGSSGILDYINVRESYAVVFVDIGFDTDIQLLTSTFDVIGKSPEDVILNMETARSQFKQAFDRMKTNGNQ